VKIGLRIKTRSILILDQTLFQADAYITIVDNFKEQLAPFADEK